MSLAERKIILSPIGEGLYSILEQVRGDIQDVYGIETEIIFLLENVDFAFDRGRNQYHSTPILEKLTKKAPDHALKVAALTGVDLFIPILTHVYGEAQLGGTSSIVSVFRLDEGFSHTKGNPAFVKRVSKEMIHELGHTFGLKHCPEKNCIMHYARSVRDVDTKTDQPCRYCQVYLKDEMRKL
jgi:archaemetzincin